MELKPCPFCAGEAEYRDDLSEEGEQYSMHVVMCCVCTGSISGNSEWDVKDEWNNRKE